MNSAAKNIQARQNMVDCQIHTQGVVWQPLLDAFAAIPREIFAPDMLQNVAYNDENTPLAPGRFLLEPGLHARLLQALEPRAGMKVLDIGAGSGYNAALLAHIGLHVYALESQQNLLQWAGANWKSLAVGGITPVHAPLQGGYPTTAPYDLIFINGAVADVPLALLQQLSPGGRLACVIRQAGRRVGQAMLFKPVPAAVKSCHALFEAGCPYLGGFEPVETFNF